MSSAAPSSSLATPARVGRRMVDSISNPAQHRAQDALNMESTI
jgi:hypothetical protein